jgi:hypothetical protein
MYWCHSCCEKLSVTGLDSVLMAHRKAVVVVTHFGYLVEFLLHPQKAFLKALYLV